MNRTSDDQNSHGYSSSAVPHTNGGNRFSLILRMNDGEEREFHIDQPRTVIGRQSRCDVHVALPIINGKHCEVVLDDDQLHVRDLNTELGTLLNGQPLTAQTPLQDGDLIGIGPIEFVVRDRKVLLAEDGGSSLKNVPVDSVDVVVPRRHTNPLEH